MLNDLNYQKAIFCRLAAALFTALMASLVVPAFGQTEASYQASLKTISGEIKSLSRNLNANRSLLEKEQTELLEIEQDLYKIRKNLELAVKGLRKTKLEIKNLAVQRIILERENKKNGEVLAALLMSHYKNGTANNLKQILNQENPYQLGRLNNYRDYFSKAVRQSFERVETQLKEIDKLKTEQGEAATKFQSLQQEQEFLQRASLARLQKRQSLIAKLQSKVSSAENKLTKLKADRSRLNELLNKLAKQKAEMQRIEKERIEAERMAAEQAKAQGKEVRKVIRKPIRGGFTKQRGRLICPLNQKPETKFGQRIVSSGMRSEGILYKTDKSIDVKSLFRGQVLFADFLKGFGLLLIIDHGEDHISLYGHNEVLYKQVGDSVETNEVVSKTGKTGGLKSPGLYFEIRKNTTPIDPGQWCQ